MAMIPAEKPPSWPWFLWALISKGRMYRSLRLQARSRMQSFHIANEWFPMIWEAGEIGCTCHICREIRSQESAQHWEELGVKINRP